jgi:hypothetical protein
MLPPDGWFNQRRISLALLIDHVRRVIRWHCGRLAGDDPVRLLGSAPITLATYTRGDDNRTLNGSEYVGVASSKGAKLFGLRLQVTTTVGHVVDVWLLALAALHDTTPMGAVFAQAHGLLVLGDGAYHRPSLEPVWREQHRLEVRAPPRRDSRKRAPWSKARRRFLGRVRRKIETARRVLQIVVHIEPPNARSLRGMVCRISTRLLAYNLCCVTGSLLVQLATKQTSN